MAAALKTKARQSSVDRDIKIMQISEDILTVLKVFVFPPDYPRAPSI